MKEKNKKVRFWLFYHFGLLIFSFVAAALMKYQQTGDALHQTVYVTFITIFLMSAGIGYLAIYMVNRAKRYNQAQITKRMLPALLVFYIAAGLIANAAVTIGVFGWFIYSGRDLSEFWPHLFKYELNFANARFFIWLMFFTIAFFYVLWQKAARKEQKLREENLAYRYRNLKAQVNPHFLFNNLNTLSEIVHEDPVKADHYIQKLSGIYRYILENEETDLITANRELDFVSGYFDLQKERDGDKIQLVIDFPGAGKFKLIPVSLQILVENALKHNAISEENPLEIQIYNENDSYIVVANTIRKKNILPQSHQTGLANLKERVKLITGKEIIILEDQGRFIVKLPLIKIEMNVLIIEDEKPASRKLIRLLEQIDPGIEITSVIPSVEIAINWFLKNSPPGLIFMDIQLEDGLCFEIFEKCDIRTPVIFTTAYDEYTLRAFKVNSVDYLLKPIDPGELKHAIGKFRMLHNTETVFAGFESMISQFAPKTKERFLVKIGEHYKSVPVTDIDCFYIKERCNFLLTRQGKSYPVDYSLDNIEQMVDPKLFFRISRNAIINFTAIKDVIAYSSSRLKIILSEWAEDDELLVSRERVADFKGWMDR